MGIMARLHRLRTAKEAALRGASGRDVVISKVDVVEAELGLEYALGHKR